MEITAAVVREKGQPFTLETLDLETPRPGEILVRVVAVGICHTDIKTWKQVRPVPLPIVLGHEGVGIVERIGADVTKVRPGDHVVMSYHSCGTCANCQAGLEYYCERLNAMNFGGARLDGTSPIHKDGETIHGAFFGQSSFATYALASQRNVVKVPGDVPLELLGPLGCGVQTGAGAVLNAFDAEAGASIAIFGVGSVGLSAVMGAVVAGCKTIIALDVQPQRLELAQELGATHALNVREITDPVKAIHDIHPGGAHYALDTTGNPEVFAQAVKSIRIAGKCGFVGGMAPGQTIEVEANHLLLGRQVRGIIQGESRPDIFIPHLIELYQQGRFPFDRLVTYFDFADINAAVAAMEAGEVVKPVLRMSY